MGEEDCERSCCMGEWKEGGSEENHRRDEYLENDLRIMWVERRSIAHGSMEWRLEGDQSPPRCEAKKEEYL